MSGIEKYEAVIGMEVHVELQTASKLFCRCPAEHFQVPANEHVCPVCTSQPGSLPVVNERALELTVMTGMALNCEIRPHSIFARKNYVYPDLPKGYQISQYELPLCTGGWAEIADGGGARRVGIERVHLEEDTGKLVHESARQPRRLQPRRRAADGDRLRLVAALRRGGLRLPAEGPAAGALPRGLDR